MAKTKKEEKTSLLVRLYTSLKFWGGLLLLFYLTFFILLLLSSQNFIQSSLNAGLMVAMMPFVANFIPGLRNFLGGPQAVYVLPAIVWALELGLIAWLKFKAAKLEKRTIIIIGSVVLLLLVTQFVGCTMLILRISAVLHQF